MLTLKQFLALCESPSMDDSDARSTSFPNLLHALDQHHHSAHSYGGGHYHNNVNDSDYFYHKPDGKSIDAVSEVEDGFHRTFFKDRHVESSVPLQNFKHALNHFGTVSSDVTHTKGQKHFWMNLHDKIPGISLSVSIDGGDPVNHTKDMLIRNQDEIWGKDKDGILLHASI